MSIQPPPDNETAEERFERISKMPGVIVHRRVGPPQPYIPDPSIRVRQGLTVREILGYNDDDDVDFESQ
jgi:hypothetical protein